MRLSASRSILVVACLAGCGAAPLALAQAASGTATAGLTVKLVSTDAAAVHAFAAAFRQRGFDVQESSEVMPSEPADSGAFDPASAPRHTTLAPTEATTTAWRARASKVGLPTTGQSMAEEAARCHAFVEKVGGSCTVQSNAAR